MMSGSPLPSDGIANNIRIAPTPSLLLTAIGAILGLPCFPYGASLSIRATRVQGKLDG